MTQCVLLRETRKMLFNVKGAQMYPSPDRWNFFSGTHPSRGFIYSIAGCVTGQSDSSRRCHSQRVIIAVIAMYIVT